MWVTGKNRKLVTAGFWFQELFPQFSYVKYHEKVVVPCVGKISVVNYEGQLVNFRVLLSICINEGRRTVKIQKVSFYMSLD